MQLNFYEIQKKLVNLDTVAKIERGEDVPGETYQLMFFCCNGKLEVFKFEERIEREKIYNEIMIMSMREVRSIDRR
jgi:hypothetical protein